MSTTFWIQLLGTLFGIIMMYFTFVKFKRRELGKSEFLIWSIGWIIFIIIASMPTILDPIVETFNFYRRLDFFVVIGFFALLGLGFYNYSVVRKNQKKIEGVVRKIAIENKIKK